MGTHKKKLEQLELERPKSSKMQDYNKIQHSRRPSSPEENPENGTETIKMMRSKVTIAMQGPTVPMPPLLGTHFWDANFLHPSNIWRENAALRNYLALDG
ncbi:MAG: hypothetical protein ACI3X9_10460 [Bacteroidaceae bacterium]